MTAHQAGILWEGVAAVPSPPSITTMPPVSNTTHNNLKNPKIGSSRVPQMLPVTQSLDLGPKQCHFIQAQVLVLRRITIPVPCSSGRSPI